MKVQRTGRDVVAFTALAELALQAALEIGPRAAGVRYGFDPKALAAAVRQPRVGPRYVGEPPAELMDLARRLGYSRKELMRMEAKHGDQLRARLQREWRLVAQEKPEFLPKNPARPPTTNPVDSIEDGEIVDPDQVSRSFVSRQHHRQAEREKVESAGDLLAAMRELRQTIDNMDPERKRRISKTLWTLRSRLDSAERELRRRLAA